MSNRWIQSAKINKGALRRYIKKKYGNAGFTDRGTIKTSILHELIRDPKVTMRTKRRAQLALNLRGMKMNKRPPRRRR